jgi:hypothetical protein
VSADGRPLGGGDPRPAPEGRDKENRSAPTIVTDPADRLQPVAAALVAEGTDDPAHILVKRAGRAALRVVGGELLVSCPVSANGIVRKAPGVRWVAASREWGLAPEFADGLANALRYAGFDVRRDGMSQAVVRVGRNRPALPECSNDDCRAPFRLAATTPITCRVCGERVERFHIYNLDA